MSGKVPDLSWKRISYEELKKRVNTTDPIIVALLKLVKEEMLEAWIDDEGAIRYQYKPEVLRGLEL